MKKFKIPPCLNHSLSPTAGKVAPLPFRLALRLIQPRLKLSSLFILGSVFGRGGLEDTSSSYKNAEMRHDAG